MTKFQDTKDKQGRMAVANSDAPPCVLLRHFCAFPAIALLLGVMAVFSLSHTYQAQAADPGARHDGNRSRMGRASSHSSGGGKAAKDHRNEQGFFDDDAHHLDHQRALAGVKSGRYRSLKQVIQTVGIPASSRIIHVELSDRDGIDVYALIVRDVTGRVERMTVNAQTGKRID